MSKRGPCALCEELDVLRVANIDGTKKEICRRCLRPHPYKNVQKSQMPKMDELYHRRSCNLKAWQPTPFEKALTIDRSSEISKGPMISAIGAQSCSTMKVNGREND